MSQLERKSILHFFLDYGDCKELLPGENECHKEVGVASCYSTPILHFRFRLPKVEPKEGKYPQDFLDGMHKKIVEKRARIRVISDDIRFPQRAHFLLADAKGQFSLDLAENFRLSGYVCYKDVSLKAPHLSSPRISFQ